MYKRQCQRYPTSRELFILADGGGSNGPRSRVWRKALQDTIRTPLGLVVTVSHYPPGASKWNPIEMCIRDSSKIEAGRLELESIEFNLRDCIALSIRTLAFRAHQNGLELTCDIRPEVPERVVGDLNRLRQIIINLIGNAIKFTGRGEVGLRIAVDSRTPDELRLHFVVTDTGVGIAPEKQKLIFDAFSQADGSTARKFGGTGLGLTISSRLVELMGGTLSLIHI